MRWVRSRVARRAHRGARRGARHRRAGREGARCARGFDDPDAARRFLHPAFDDLHDPLAMRDMPAALDRLARAIRGGEKILIYGDYDVDGTTSVVLLTKAIELAGGAADYHVPHRLKDGYGMRAEVVEAARREGRQADRQRGYRHPRRRSGGRANELGIDVIVTDHHLPETRTAAGAGGPQSQPARLRVSGEEPVRRGRRVQAGAGAAGHASAGRRIRCGGSASRS